MLETAQPPGTLQRLPSFSGVVFLIALLFSLPWLPLSSPVGVSRADRAAAFYATAPAVPHVPKTPANWHFTIHVTATLEEALALEQEFPNSDTDLVVAVPREEDLDFLRYRRDLNDQRQRNQLPAAKLDDRRPPAPN
jgi:hypothetical protein